MVSDSFKVLEIKLDWLQLFVITSLLLLPLLYEASNTFKYYAKFLLFNCLVMLAALVSIPLLLLRPKNVDNYRIWMGITSSILSVFSIKSEKRGLENLKSEKSYILVCNHQSSIDIIGMMDVWPEKCTGLAKKELLFAGPAGPAGWLCGLVFIDRVNKEKSHETMKETMTLLKDKNIKLWIFPEGTRNHEGAMLPFKKGAFHLAIESKMPIVPVVFSSYSEFYSKKEKRFGTGKFIITCLPPVKTEALTVDDVSSLSEQVRKQMLEVFNDTSLEATQSRLMVNGASSR